jgi:hypothetical protein
VTDGQPRPRDRRRTTWGIAALLAVLVGGLAIALAVLGGSDDEPTAVPSTVRVTTAPPPPVDTDTTPPAATAPPPGDKKGLFEGGFEGGSPEWKPYDDLQREDDRPWQDSFALVGEPVRQGDSAARITVRQGYSRFGHNEDTELVWQSQERNGDDYWYAWSTLFPEDWSAPDKWGIFAQWHANLGTSPVIAFNARGDEVQLNVHSGLTDEAGNSFAINRNIPILDTMSKGRWNDFVMHVRWRTDDTGSIDVFHRVEGESSLRRIARLEGLPTFQFRSDGHGVGTYLLLGLYRGSYCSQPTVLGCESDRGEQSPNVLYHDGFTRASSFEGAVARAFPGPPPLHPDDPRAAESVALAPLPLGVVAGRAAVRTDPGCGACRVAEHVGGFAATIANGAEARDSAVAVYRIKQLATVAIRQRFVLDSPARLDGNLAVTQLRRTDGTRLVELYIASSDGTLRVYSPPGVLTEAGLNEPTGIEAAQEGGRRVELRLTGSRLTVAVDGRVRVQVDGVKGPTRGTQLIARVGIAHYDGTATSKAVATTHDDVEVGAAN